MSKILRGRVERYALCVGLWLSACSDSPGTGSSECPILPADDTSSTPLVLRQVSSGSYANCGAASDGSVRCWGTSASPVNGVANAVAVTVGGVDACAIRRGGSVVCWRSSDSGAPISPENIAGLCGATSLSPRDTSQCALMKDGTVQCWGSLFRGVFGIDSARAPVPVPGLSNATGVAIGRSGYTCVLQEDGSVVCWGGGPRLGRPGPNLEVVPEIAGATALSSGSAGQICAIPEDRSVSCWDHARAPAPLLGLSDVSSISISMGHGCAALGDGTVRCWGNNETGQLGNGTRDNSDAPVTVDGVRDAVQASVGSISSGFGRSCALLANGTATCWGRLSTWWEPREESTTPVPIDLR